MECYRARHKTSKKFGWLVVYNNKLYFLENDAGIRPFSSEFDRFLQSSPPSSMAFDDFERHQSFTGDRVLAFADNYGGVGSRRSSLADISPPPLVFEKPIWALTSEFVAVQIAHLTARGANVWGEGELGVVVNRDGIPQFVTVVNDVTMDLAAQSHHDHHLPYYKGQANFLPCSSQIFDPQVLNSYSLQSFQAGVLLREGSDQSQLYDFDSLMRWLRSWYPLSDNTMILLGAPKRVRDRMYLSPGGSFEVHLNGKLILRTEFI